MRQGSESVVIVTMLVNDTENFLERVRKALRESDGNVDGMNATNFPTLRAADRRPESFDRNIETIFNAVNVGAIRNAELNDIKFALSNTVDTAWHRVCNPYVYSGRDHYLSLPSDVREFYESLPLISNLHDILSASRRVAKTKATGEFVDVIRAFVTEVLPLAEAVAALKSKVVKGRAPSAPKPVNPNKIIKTCGVCFRPIAVGSNGKMVHHGYERPGFGFQTASCPGIDFRPLEVSSEGLEWLIGRLRSRLSNLKTSLADSGSLVELTEPTRKGIVKILKGEPNWDRFFASYVQALNSNIRSLKIEIPRLEERLAKWQPES